MTSSNGDPSVEPSGVTSVDLGPATTVVVPTGGGVRYHRPNGLGFETACRTTFGRSVRSVPLALAVRDGFSPCRKPACFGETQG